MLETTALEKNVVNAPKKSLFVSIIAVLFAMLSAACVLHSVFSLIAYPVSISEIYAAEQNKFFAIALIAFFVIGFGLFVSIFISSIGVFQRKNWARILFIINMSIAIALNIVLAVHLTQLFVWSNEAISPSGIAWLDTLVSMIDTIIDSLFYIFYIGVMAYAFISSILFGWLVITFRSEKIKIEFGMPHKEINHWRYP
jgi:hypothetical protein